MKDIYKYNKTTIWIGIATVIILTVGLVIYFQKDTPDETKTQIVFKDEYDLVLFGGDEEIYLNSRYQDPGYYAILNNEIVSDQVSIDNPLDVSKVGEYEIRYTYRNITKTRIVKVIDDSNSSVEEKEDEKEDNSNDVEEYKIELKLNGSNEINLKLNEAYKELGAKATDSKGNDLSKEIKISGSIDTNKTGSYKITYTINKNGVSKSLERIVNVLNETVLTITAPKQTSYINGDITVIAEANGNNYLYMKLPDNTITKDVKSEYIIKENGTYTFQAVDRDNTVHTKRVTVKNIDKINPSGSCIATINNSKTTINVNATDNIGINYFLYNGTDKSDSNMYTYNSVLNKANVSIYDKAGNFKTISCTITNQDENKTINPAPVKEFDDGNIEMHFMVSGHDDDAILIRTDNYTIMIDGGRYEDRKNVIPYLQDLGIKKIDALIGSHVHYNHVQAQAAIIDSFEVSHAYYSVDIFNCIKLKQCKGSGEKLDNKYIAAKLKEKKIPTTVLTVGDYLEFGEMKLYFIGPLAKKMTTHENANSFVFILKYRNTSYMFTGDAPSKDMDAAKFQENAKKWNLSIDIDVLKWPHHGYNDLNDAFFAATTPKYAIVPTSNSCSSKYPSSVNKKLIQKYGTKYYQRCEYKNMVLISDGTNIDIKTNQKAIDYKR